MRRLSLDDLKVLTFDPQPAVSQDSAYQPYTQNNPICYSPWCAPTFQAGCETGA